MSGAVLTDGTGREVRWLKSLADIDACASPWQALDKASTADFVWFQSFSWCRTWIAEHASAAQQPQILVLLNKGTPEAILPLVLKQGRFRVKTLEVLGQPHTQYANILTATGKLSADAINIIRSALGAQTAADCIIFNYVPAGSALAAVLADVPARAELVNQASMLDLTQIGEGQNFESTRSPRAQKRLRRHVRLFEREFGMLTFSALRPGDAGYASLVHSCVEMKKQWLTATGKMGSGLMRFDHARFLSRLPSVTDTDGPILWVLRGDTKLIAVEAGFIQRGHYYCYISSFDLDLWKLSPGKLQKAMTINGLIDRGAITFDLMGNTTDYKDNYANRRVALSGAIINATLRGRLYTATWTATLEPALRRWYYILPNAVRQPLAAARRVSFSASLPPQMDASGRPSES